MKSDLDRHRAHLDQLAADLELLGQHAEQIVASMQRSADRFDKLDGRELDQLERTRVAMGRLLAALEQSAG